MFMSRGIGIFGWPVAFEFWNIYLPKYINWSLGGKDSAGLSGVKLERVRELFEQAIKGIPAQYARSLYVMYGETEETARPSPQVLDSAGEGMQCGG